MPGPTPSKASPSRNARIRALGAYGRLGQTVAYGLAGGFAAVAFLKLSKGLFAALYGPLAAVSPLRFAAGSFAAITLSSLAVGWMLARLCRSAAGSGIPDLKTAYWSDTGAISWRAAWVKLVAGVISLGGGASLGREGPSVFTGAAAASALAGRFGVPNRGRRPAATSGAAAGLAAAFNTPLAAITFVLEEIVGDLNSRHLGAGLLAAVVGAFCAHAMVGAQPAFDVRPIAGVGWRAYALTPVVAALAAIIGAAFQRATLALRSRVRARAVVPGWARPVIGGWIVWLVGVPVFAISGRMGVFGLGYEDLSAAMRDGIVWQVALLLLVAKFPATVAAYAWGGCGGIFAPTLFMGAMAGFAVAGVAGTVMPVAPDDAVLLASVGMCACFGAVARAPLTSLLMIFEMTHRFQLVPALMLGTLVAQAISRAANRENFYTALLIQDGHELHRIRPPRDLRGWRNLPVSTLVNPRPAVVRSLAPDDVRATLADHPYRAFPVEIDGRFRGVVLRADLEAAIDGIPPKLLDAAIAKPAEPIRAVAARMVASSSDRAVLLDPATGAVCGWLTLRDILRAQTPSEG